MLSLMRSDISARRTVLRKINRGREASHNDDGHERGVLPQRRGIVPVG